MSLSYLGNEFMKSGKTKAHLGSLAAQLMTTSTKTADTLWRLISAHYVVSAMLRVTSALAVSYWLVQMVKHNIS